MYKKFFDEISVVILSKTIISPDMSILISSNFKLVFMKRILNI